MSQGTDVSNGGQGSPNSSNDLPRGDQSKACQAPGCTLANQEVSPSGNGGGGHHHKHYHTQHGSSISVPPTLISPSSEPAVNEDDFRTASPEEINKDVSKPVTAFSQLTSENLNANDNARLQQDVVPRYRKQIRNGASSVRSSQSHDAEAVLFQRARLEELFRAYNSGDSVAADAIAEIARSNGIPGDLRRQAWPILLETHPIRLTGAHIRGPVLSMQHMEPAKDMPIRRIRGEIARFHKRRKTNLSTRNTSSSLSVSPAAGATTPLTTTSATSSSAIAPDRDALEQLALDTAVEAAVIGFLERNDQLPYAPGMIHVCFTLADWIFAPLGCSSFDPNAHYTQHELLCRTFDQIMAIMLWYPPSSASKDSMEHQCEGALTRRITHFLAVSRRLLPELTAYFDEEEVNGFAEEWVHSWIKWWCARELPGEQKGRLWDFYLGYRPSVYSSEASRSSSNTTSPASPAPPEPRASIDVSDGNGEEEAPARPNPLGQEDENKPLAGEAYTPADWHTYVCVALLKACKDELEELELSEIRALLSRLPKLNVNAILAEARKARRELRELGLREDEEVRRRADQKY
ncbi:RabGAP/TBC [Xylona heveae TC161]|uniref:RabGAP/TBC n=1 Tax=Xylona heveae (strain CBS 132557 / TC161) TaxID=1328760 RepID=A0A165FD27_XYLHT|nr:RabGAP/TBC [Xylona heveae TC161]KZF20841.1 RabGAP/TBC [Xylona heveae TC161]